MQDETLLKVLRILRQADEAELSVISDTVRKQYRALAAQRTDDAIASIKPGDIVVLTNLKPKYLNGLHAEVLERWGPKFKVLVQPGADPRVNKRFAGCPVIPGSCLRKVNP
ncbi:MAG: hypothetical protein ACRD8U_13075 [Pyrinomonadaceae bacterium]